MYHAGFFTRFGKISGRVWSSHGLYFGETVGRAKLNIHGETKQALIFSQSNRAKTCTITYLSSLTSNVFLKTKVSRLEKPHSYVNPRTYVHVSRAWSTALLQKITFGGNFEMNACVASFSPLLLSLKRCNNFTLIEI